MFTDVGVGAGGVGVDWSLRGAGALPLRAAVFLTDQPALLDEWFRRGPEIDPEARLVIRGVKMYADGALGSRGAALRGERSVRSSGS